MFSSLKFKFAFSFFILEVIILVLIISINLNSLTKASYTLMEEKNDISSKLLIEIIKVPLIMSDLAFIEDAVQNFLSLKGVIAVKIDDYSKTELVSYIKKGNITKKEFEDFRQKETNTLINNKYIFNTFEILIESQVLGRVYFIYSIEDAIQNIQYNTRLTYTLALLSLLVGLIMAYLLGRWLSNSIERLTAISKSVALCEDVTIEYKKNPKNEIETLFVQMFLMQENILKNTNELKQFVHALHSSAIVSKTDADGYIISVNDKFCNVTGYTQDEIIGKTHSLIRHPETDTSFYDVMWKTIQTKNIYKDIFKNIKKNGTAYYVDATITPLLSKDGIIQEYISISFDITEIIEAKHKAQEAKKIKDQFLSNMSHEIRTPLNAILGFIDILKKNIHNKENLKYINTIKSSSSSLLQIINDILDVSKMQNDKLLIDKHKFDIYLELSNIIETFEFQAIQKSINLELIFDDNVPQCLDGDLLRIKQILYNFLSNALKFTNEGKNVYVKVYYDYDSSHMFISVIDEGIGLTEAEQEKVFFSFEQADNSTTRKFGGTGLGLCISLGLAKLMEGEIILKSKKGKGSTFTLSLPMKICDFDVQTEDETIEEDIHFKANVLIAEDNKTNQMLIKLLLSDYNIVPKIMNDGLEAVAAFKCEKFDLVLMDENMPNMTGLKALDKILEYEKKDELAHTPIVALTANVLPEDKKMFLSAGMDDFLAKPIDIHELERILKKYLVRDITAK